MSRYIPSQVELRLLHPAVARLLDGRGCDWYHEVQVAGRFRVDFLAFGHDRASLIDCKASLYPKEDIAKINLYHDLYGDPTAHKVIATPNVDYPYEVLRQYADAGVAILRVEGQFTPDKAAYNYQQVDHMYPERSGVFMRLTREQAADIRKDYDPYKVTMDVLAKRYDVSVATISYVLRTANREPLGYYPAEYLENEL